MRILIVGAAASTGVDDREETILVIAPECPEVTATHGSDLAADATDSRRYAEERDRHRGRRGGVVALGIAF